jgi:ABC-type phosphate transport system auxiliary subunit
MTEGRAGAGPTDEDVLAVAEAMYREAAVELLRTIDAIRGGAFGEVKSAQAAIRDLRATASQVLEERGRIDKLRKQLAGQVGSGGAIDFDAARAEIGRRLACLRNAGGSG